MNSLIDRFKAVGVCTLSDALDKLAIDGQCLGIMPFGSAMRIAGPAFTIRMLPVGLSGGVVGDYIDDVPEGAIVALDNRGRKDATVWGDILTHVAKHKGIGGTVIDGVCRDISTSLEENYPLFAKTNTHRTGKDRVTADAYNVTIELSGVRVEAGDWLVGDGDGVVCIPKDRLEEVLETAEQIAEVEEKIVAAVKKGMRLDEARAELKYHSLQTANK